MSFTKSAFFEERGGEGGGSRPGVSLTKEPSFLGQHHFESKVLPLSCPWRVGVVFELDGRWTGPGMAVLCWGGSNGSGALVSISVMRRSPVTLCSQAMIRRVISRQLKQSLSSEHTDRGTGSSCGTEATGEEATDAMMGISTSLFGPTIIRYWTNSARVQHTYPNLCTALARNSPLFIDAAGCRPF